MKLSTVLCSAGLALTLAACPSLEEQELRKTNAFNLSGEYLVINRGPDEAAFSLKITNEVGRHDIVGEVFRETTMTSREQYHLQQYGISSLGLQAFLGSPMIFGKGETSTMQGGENISKDGGESSEFYICTGTYYEQSFFSTGEPSTAQYCLRGEKIKGSDYISGTLELNVYGPTSEKDRRTGKAVYRPSQVAMEFQTETKNHFDTNQFFGEWTLNFYDEETNFLSNGMKGLLVSRVSGNEIRVSPKETFQIQYQGETFSYSESQSRMDFEEFQKDDIPTLRMVFEGSSSERLILFRASIHSLGEVTGLVDVLDRGPRKIASFRAAKK